jgi:hypothetical protein
MLMHNTAYAAESGVIHRSGWSYDRANMQWYRHLDAAMIQQKKAQGLINDMTGWTEYDIDIPASGWFELVLKGCAPEWGRDVYLDGKRIVTLGTSGPEDVVDGEAFKFTNIYLSQGKHAIKFRRLNYPGDLPGAFELRPASGKPAGCISASIVGHTIRRVGEKFTLSVTGGTTAPVTYDIIAVNALTTRETAVGTVRFPVTQQPITKTLTINCTAEGVFMLRARVNGQQLRPSDFRVAPLAVIDTRGAAAAPTEMTKTLIHDIDCVQQTNMGKPIVNGEGFWEATEPTRITTSKAGSYRESGDNTDPNLPHPPTLPSYRKFNSGFAYAIDVPQAQELYLLEVDYPDDDRRTANVFVLEPHPEMPCQLYGGYECGDWYELSHQMQTEQVLFWARGTTVRAAILSKNPGMRAAASRIRVYKIEGGLPDGPAMRTDGRLFMHWMEEPSRWLWHGLPPENMDPMAQDFIAMERYVRLCRYYGFNAVCPTEAIYQALSYHSDELEGWFAQPYDAVRIMALMCEKYDMRYVPELHLSGQEWFTKQVVEKLAPNPEDLYTTSRFGTSARDGGSLFSSSWNPLHPAIQEKYTRIIGELTDKLADSPAFGGVSSRLMAWAWQGWNGIPSLHWGYGDWTIAEFSKETGVKVPGEPTDPDRFEARFQFLTSPAMIEQWQGWRHARMLAYYQRLRDRLQVQQPYATLYLPYFGDAVSGMDLVFGTFSQTEHGALAEAGVELDALAEIPGICIMPSGLYGRRDLGDLVADARVADSITDPVKKQLGFAYERAFCFTNAYFEDQQQIPVHQLGLPDWAPSRNGGNNGAAEGAGRHVLEKLAYALADQDSTTLLQGGMGYTFGRAAEYREWLAEYAQLPRLPFTPLDTARDPVAVWYRACPDGFYFYAVNREPYEVNITLTLAKAKTIQALGASEQLALPQGRLTLALKPYQLRAFKAPRRAALVSAETHVPQDRIQRVKDRLAFFQQLGCDITTGIRRLDVTEAERTAFQQQLDTAWNAFQHGQYWRARTALSHASVVALCAKLAVWPDNMLDRRMGLGLLRTENRNIDQPSAVPMLDAQALAGMLVSKQDVRLVSSATYHRDWTSSTVLASDTGVMDFEMQVAVPGRYRLSLGHVADHHGAITVSLGGKNMAVLAQTKTPNQPESTVFPVVELPGGTLRLRIRGQGSFGLYGVTLQPVYRPMPSPNWMTIGPFPTEWYAGGSLSLMKEALQRIDPPMQAIDLPGEYAGVKNTIRWKYSDEVRSGVPHFDATAGVSFLYRAYVQEGGVCYATTTITSPEERDAEILIGCDWWANAWLNGELLQTDRPAAQVEEDGAYFNAWRPLLAKCRLKKGVNTLLVKTHGGSVANWFTCYISDPGDLTITPRP